MSQSSYFKSSTRYGDIWGGEGLERENGNFGNTKSGEIGMKLGGKNKHVS